MNLNGATALVAGGASGLGAATAAALSAAGAAVVVLDLESQRERIEPGSELTFAAGDVTDPSTVTAAIAAAEAIAPLRVAVNCAGIGIAGRTVGRDGPLDLDVFRKVIEVNLIGSFNVGRLAGAAIQEHEPVEGERGVIVNTASVAAFEGQIGQVAYAASKGGIVGMTLPIARDLSRMLVRCVTIAPGLFDTPLFATIRPEEKAALEASVPHPSRLGDPAEYGALVAHIVANPMLNGETIRLDGAIRMGPR
jgi:NAD(P)-dependent dehydrogenase (short-subunit alcohol dehydrogenase family)